jgi:site-specific recombinase XerD
MWAGNGDVLGQDGLRYRTVTHNMRLKRNLFQDRDGQWHLTFHGEELKVSHRRGKTNTFHVNLSTHCPDLLPHLEEFLHTFRPKIPHADSAPCVFLTHDGRPYNQRGLLGELRVHVYRFTQRRFYPHLIRTIWATEFISKTGDFTTAAYMLNDNVKTVLQQYQEILEKEHAQKASDFLKRTLGV